MIEQIFYHFCNDPIYRAQTLKHKKRYEQKENEHSRIITETNLYSFNVGLLMGMRCKK